MGGAEADKASSVNPRDPANPPLIRTIVAMRTPDATSDVGHAVTLIEEHHGPPSARLQSGLTAMWSHTAVVRPRAAVRYLYWAQITINAEVASDPFGLP